MDYIENKLTAFEEKVKEFEHSYDKGDSRLLCSWKKRFPFFELMLDILDFIEDTPILLAEYNKRVGAFSETLINKTFIDSENEIVNIIANETGNKEFKNNYYKINAHGYVNNEINKFFGQFEKEAGFTKNLNLNTCYKKICQYFDKLRKLKAHEFSMFDIHCAIYKDNKFIDSMEAMAIIDADCYEIYSLEIVRSTLKIIETLKNYYAKTKLFDIKENDKLSINNGFTTEEINVLKLRKKESPNTFKDIGNKMVPSLSECRVKQISMNIRNKLSAQTIDEAVRKYEENFEKL